MQSYTIDIENLCCAGLVEIARLKHPQDVGPLHLIETLRWTIRDGRLENEILFAYLGLLRDNHGALYGILQFTNISDPRLLL
jgi:hypothetical protein